MKAISRGRIGHPATREFLWLLRSIFAPLNQRSKIKVFEESFAKYVGRQHCTAFPLGRVGIHSILKILDLPVGTKILMPTVSIKGILDSVLDLGLEPIFIDLDLNTFNWDENQLDKILDEKPKVAILTYLFGVVPNLNFILNKLKEKNIFVIEDFSQAWNATHNNRKAGQFGDASIYSTSSLKSIDTFGGGMVLTDDTEFYKKLQQIESNLARPRRLKLCKKIMISLLKNILTYPIIFTLFTFPLIKLLSRGNNKFERFVGNRDQNPISELPINWFRRYTSFQAGIGIYMLKNSEKIDHNRIFVGELYLKQSKNIESINKLKSFGQSVYWQYIVIVEDFSKFKIELQHQGIDTGLTSLINLSELANYGISNRFPNAFKLYNNGAYIPCFAQLSVRDTERVLNSLSKSKLIRRDI
jgi:dTDP-4-amino-4,6-dideoxygalactose transaminase